MLEIYFIATIWLALAILATILANRFKMSMALMEILIGAIAGYTANYFFGPNSLKADSEWLKFIAGTGAIILTFLAGAELDPVSLKAKIKESSIVGIIGLLAPFIICTLLAKFVFGWNLQAGLLAGIVLSTTSMAIIYTVMMEYGFNKTEFGKGVLVSCFINDLGTVIVLGLIFTPFSYKTIIFILVSGLSFFIIPSVTSFLTRTYGFRTVAIRTKWVLFLLFGLGTLALWAGSEAVLPAYITGMVLAGTISKDNFFIKRIRTLTIGFLTPFYFLRAGSLVSIPAVISAPVIFLVFFAGKVLPKIFCLYPVIKQFRNNHKKETWYYTLLMSTGLTFGTISALYGLTHNIITKEQYSYLVAVVIGSAIIPTIVANMAFLPKHLLEAPVGEEEEMP
ncbi:cation:proton antiporter [Candidatus Desantisbacteria bacterium]|nr:cation:proton antiporter [Candidatus Desantisbacteria bacterium]